LNRALLVEIRRFRPDVLLSVQKDYEIWTETLLELRKTSIALITWTTDDSFKFNRVSKYIGPLYDAISTTYEYRLADYARCGIQGAYLTQWAANSHWLKPPTPASYCNYGVTFIGAMYGNRAEIVQTLKSMGIEVTCYGFNWPNGPIPTEEIPGIMNSSIISLNFSGGFLADGNNAQQIKARTFEVPGAGGFLLTEDAPGLDQYYALGQEIGVYRSTAELAEKIRYYLNNPSERDGVAQAGYKRTASCHTYEQRLSGLLEFGMAQRDARVMNMQGGAMPASEVDEARLPTPRVGWALRTMRECLVGACRLIWGRDRGLRAARRITFEVSIRLAGKKTFSGYGLPGRLFPYI